MGDGRVPDCAVAALILTEDAQKIPALRKQAKAVEELLLDYYWPETELTNLCTDAEMNEAILKKGNDSVD